MLNAIMESLEYVWKEKNKIAEGNEEVSSSSELVDAQSCCCDSPKVVGANMPEEI